jgi:hypothetical protein
MEALRSSDAEARTNAWLAAGKVGTPAIPALVELMVQGEMESARAARSALRKIVRTVGTPGTQRREKQKTVDSLIALLADDQPEAVRREAIWLVSELADDSASETLQGLLGNQELREDARCALERIPGRKSLAALEKALKTVPDDFKMNIVQSLRARGVEVPGYPCRKLVPAG